MNWRHGSSDVNKTLIRSNFHPFIVQLWYSFPDIFVNADVVNAQSGRGGILPKKSSRVEQIKKSLDLQISSLVGYFKKINAFVVYAKCVHETVRDKWCLHKSVLQTVNGLECGFVKHWPNSDCIQSDNSL